MSERFRRISEKDARFVIKAVHAESGYAKDVKLIEAFATVMRILQERLEHGEYPKSSLLDRLHESKIELPKPIPHLLTESAVSGSRWRAFDPKLKRAGEFEEAGIPFMKGFFQGKPEKGSDKLFYLGGGDEKAESCEPIDIYNRKIDYNNLGTEISVGRQFDLEGNPNLILIVFRTLYLRNKSYKFLEILDEAVVPHTMDNRSATAFVGLEQIGKNGNPEETVYLRLRSSDLANNDTIEVTKMKPRSKKDNLILLRSA